MTVFENKKQHILLRSLKKQLTLTVQNLQQFGLKDDEIHRFIIEVILETRYDPQNCSFGQSQASLKRKSNLVDQKIRNTNLVHMVMSQIQSQLPSAKSLLKYIENCYAHNFNLTSEESFIPLIEKTPFKNLKNETSNQKLQPSTKTPAKTNTKILEFSKSSNEDSLYRRRSQIFDKELLFERKTSFERQEQNWDDDEEYDNPLNDPFTDQMKLMHQEITRLREMQMLYQKELDSKIVQKRKLLKRLDSSLESQKRSLDRVTVVAQTL